jgi:hypothetical protein
MISAAGMGRNAGAYEWNATGGPRKREEEAG